MNAIALAQNAYGHDARLTRTNRETEYDAFAKITSRLKLASARGESDFGELVAALHENRQLWTILAMDVAQSSNTLPKDLRARIVYLFEFTQLHSSKVLSRKATADVLVEINTAIMRGLRNERVK